MNQKYIWLTVIGALLISAAWLVARPPSDGQVYRFASSEKFDVEGTAILVKRGECLAVSASEQAFSNARYDAMDDDTVRALAVGPYLEVVHSAGGDAIKDRMTGHIVRVGDGFVGRMILPASRFSDGSWPTDSWKVRWPIDRNCGNGLSLVASIGRVIPPQGNSAPSATAAPR